MKPMICSETSIVDGDWRNFADSGELLWKGTDKFDLLKSPLAARICQNDEYDQTLLLDHRLELGVLAVDGTVMESGEMLR
jgi:hypothetical protein